MPKLSYPWAIVASVAIAVLGVLLALHVVTWQTVAAFIVGAVIPAVKSDGKMPPPVLPVLFMGIFAVALVVLPVVAMLSGCAQQAKSQYGLQLDTCVEKAQNRAEADACVKAIQLEWTEAGAPPALVLVKDAGVE